MPDNILDGPAVRTRSRVRAELLGTPCNTVAVPAVRQSSRLRTQRLVREPRARQTAPVALVDLQTPPQSETPHTPEQAHVPLRYRREQTPFVRRRPAPTDSQRPASVAEQQEAPQPGGERDARNVTPRGQSGHSRTSTVFSRISISRTSRLRNAIPNLTDPVGRLHLQLPTTITGHFEEIRGLQLFVEHNQGATGGRVTVGFERLDRPHAAVPPQASAPQQTTAPQPATPPLQASMPTPSNLTEVRNRAAQRVQQSRHMTCPVCLDDLPSEDLSNPVVMVNCCQRVFCYNCIVNSQYRQIPCPMCRAPLEEKNITLLRF